MSNCAICVYDLYSESLKEYRESIAALRAALSSLNIPQSEWPPSIRADSDSDSKGSGARQRAVLSAFEEMERALVRKKEQESSTGDRR